MRQLPTGVRGFGGRSGRAGFFVAVVLALAAVPVSAQTATTEPAPPARYIPRDDLVAFAEFDGVDAHADAWKKTAAYQMLNDTSLGAMLEDLGTQLADQTLAKAPGRKVGGAEVVTLIKHALRSGFAFGMTVKKGEEQPSGVMLVLRGAAAKSVRAPVSRALLSFAGKSGKPKLASKAGGRSIVVMPSDTKAESWSWWAEKDDVVIALDRPETVDTLIEVIDGKIPSAVDNPARTELAAAENGFLPVGRAFLDTASAPVPKGAGDAAKAQFAGVTRIDYRWGFQDNALMTVWRLVVPSPRQGALALLDGPKFDAKSLPPMPEAVEGFTTFSLDVPQTYEKLLALVKSANPAAADQAESAIATLKTKYKIDLRKDVLAQFGSKIAYYVAPGKPTATASAGSEKAANPGAGAMPNPLTMMLASVQIPKFAVVVEVKNGTAFGKKLDELIIAANKMLRESAKANEPPAASGGANAGNDSGGGSADRKRAAAAPAVKFEMMPGKAKAYALVLPPELGKLPAGVKPTIRVGEKFIAIGVSPAVAAQALEAKDAWKPEGDFASALASVPEGLIFLNVSDPRGTMPQELASLPRTLQTSINSAIQNALPGLPAGGQPGAAGVPGAPPGQTSSPSTVPGQTSPAGYPGTTSPPGAPNFPGAGGETNAAAAAGVVLRVDPSKMPAADALKPLLFPGFVALSVNDKEIRLVSRAAFPNIASGGSGNSPAASMILGPAMQKAREAAMKQIAAQAKAKEAAAPPEKAK